MLDKLRDKLKELLNHLFGDKDQHGPDCMPADKNLDKRLEEHEKEEPKAERHEEEKPDTKWVDRINQEREGNNGGGSSFLDRVRSLPREQEEKSHERHDQDHDRDR